MNVHNHKVTQSMQDSAQCLNKPFKGYLCHMLTDRSFIIRLFRGWGPLEISNKLKQKVLRRFFCCSSSVFVRLWFHTWRLCCPYLFLIAPVFWCLWRAVLRDYGISLVSTHICLIASVHETNATFLMPLTALREIVYHKAHQGLLCSSIYIYS